MPGRGGLILLNEYPFPGFFIVDGDRGAIIAWMAIDFRNNCRVASDCGTYRGVTHDTPLTAPLALTRRHGYGLSYNTLRAFPHISRAEALMFQFPPQPDMPLNPPGPIMQFIACILVVIATIEMIAFILPDKWRISVVQFGRRWTARRKR